MSNSNYRPLLLRDHEAQVRRVRMELGLNIPVRCLRSIVEACAQQWRHSTTGLVLLLAVVIAGVAQAQVAGALDTTFGTGGKINSLPYSGASGDARSVLVQPDGKILIGGSCDAGANPDFCFARVSSTGALDATFDGPNAAGTGVGTGNGMFQFPISFTSDSALAMALQSDGKIVVAGTCKDDNTP